MSRFSHGGHSLRRSIVVMRTFPNYGVFKRKHVFRIDPKAKDRQRTPFIVDFDIRRRLRGKNRSQEWGKALKLRPVVDRNGRGDLKVTLGAGRASFYHRVVAFEINPCTTDCLGRNIEPFFVEPVDAKKFEIHHGLPRDTHNCVAANLFVLYKEHHRSLKK